MLGVKRQASTTHPLLPARQPQLGACDIITAWLQFTERYSDTVLKNMGTPEGKETDKHRATFTVFMAVQDKLRRRRGINLNQLESVG